MPPENLKLWRTPVLFSQNRKLFGFSRRPPVQDVEIVFELFEGVRRSLWLCAHHHGGGACHHHCE